MACDPKLNGLFAALLTEYGISKEGLAEYKQQNKHDYVDLDRREEIINAMLAEVRASPEQSKEELLVKIGFDDQLRLKHYVNLGSKITVILGKIQRAIGNDAKLNALFDELLVEQGVSREKFEQALEIIRSVYDVLYDRNSPKRDITRQLVLEGIDVVWARDVANLIDNGMFHHLHPSVVIERVSIMRRMFEAVRTSDAQTTVQLAEKIGLTEGSIVNLTKNSFALFPHTREIILADYFESIQQAIGEDPELNKLLGELAGSHKIKW